MNLLGAAASEAGALGILVPVVLAAALLHASWNAILKFIPDKLTASLLMTVSSGVPAAIGILLLPAPARASWPSALRETSVIFGAALGSPFLREPFGRYRIFAAVTIASGILILEAA